MEAEPQFKMDIFWHRGFMGLFTILSLSYLCQYENKYTLNTFFKEKLLKGIFLLPFFCCFSNYTYTTLYLYITYSQCMAWPVSLRNKGQRESTGGTPPSTKRSSSA